jgi:hypothetical protein
MARRTPLRAKGAIRSLARAYVRNSLDPAALLGDAGEMMAEIPAERRRPRDEGEAQAVVDQAKRPELRVRRLRKGQPRVMRGVLRGST